MPFLPSFSVENFELWEIKMEGLLGSVDLWKFVQETSIIPHDNSRDALALFLIISTLDNTILSSILYESIEVHNAKIFWDILEMKYNVKWSEKAKVDKDIVIGNDDCVDSLITEIEIEDGSIEAAIINEESVFVFSNEKVHDDEEIASHTVYSDLMNLTTKIVDDLEHAKVDEDKGKTTPENESLMEESIFDTKIYKVKFDANYSFHEEWSNVLHEKKLIDELLFGDMRSSFAYKNQVEANLFAMTNPSKEVVDMKQPAVIAAEAANEFYYPMKDEERKALLEEQNEKYQYGSSYDFSYDHNKNFECAGLQDNDSFSVVTDYEEEMEETEEIDEENIESIFMVWNPKEIKYYYELMLQQSIEQDTDDCIQKGKQPTYEKLEKFASIKGKHFHESAEVLKTTKDSQQPSSKIQKKNVQITVK